MYNYPYGNTSQLNLDWFLQSWRVFQSQVEAMIAPQYDHSIAYPDPAIVIYEHKMYSNNQAINDPEEWDPDHWTQISCADIFLGNM